MVRLLICPVCVKARKLDEGGFVSNAEFGDEDSSVFSY